MSEEISKDAIGRRIAELNAAILEGLHTITQMGAQQQGLQNAINQKRNEIGEHEAGIKELRKLLG